MLYLLACYITLFFIRTSKFELWVNVLIFSWCFRLKMFLFCSYCNIFSYSVTGIMSYYVILLGLWLWLNFVKFVYILNPSQSQLVVLKLFLLFADFKPQCYYKIVIKKRRVYLCSLYPLCLFIKFSWSVLKFVLFYVFNYFNYYFVLKVITQNTISYLKVVNTLRLRVITLNICNKRNQWSEYSARIFQNKQNYSSVSHLQ